MTSIPQLHQQSRNHVFLSKKERKIVLKGTQRTCITSCTCYKLHTRTRQQILRLTENSEPITP